MKDVLPEPSSSGLIVSVAAAVGTNMALIKDGHGLRLSFRLGSKTIHLKFPQGKAILTSGKIVGTLRGPPTHRRVGRLDSFPGFNKNKRKIEGRKAHILIVNVL